MRFAALLAVGLLITAARAGTEARNARGQQSSPRKQIVVEKSGRVIQPSPELLRNVNSFYEADFGMASAKQVRVNLELENASVRDAVKEIFTQAKSDFVVDSDVPEDVRLTIHVRNISLLTALNLVTEAAGVGWRLEAVATGAPATPQLKSEGAPGARYQLQQYNLAGPRRYRIGKSIVGPGTAISIIGDRVMLNRMPEFFTFNSLQREERSTFTCPHCKSQTTMVRVQQQPKCTKCSRVFEKDWQYCPTDGNRRPAAPADWRYCPSCGKEVRPDKSSMSDMGDPDSPTVTVKVEVGPTAELPKPQPMTEETPPREP